MGGGRLGGGTGVVVRLGAGRNGDSGVRAPSEGGLRCPGRWREVLRSGHDRALAARDLGQNPFLPQGLAAGAGLLGRRECGCGSHLGHGHLCRSLDRGARPRGVRCPGSVVRAPEHRHGARSKAPRAQASAARRAVGTVPGTQDTASTRRTPTTAGRRSLRAHAPDPEPPDAPARLADVTDDASGRGLALVRACSDLWGWQPLSRFGNRENCVWCEVGAGQPGVTRRAS